MIKPKRRLKDIDVAEVSVVDSPANQTPFLMIKDEAGKFVVEIETDGTLENTAIKVNGEIVDNIKSFYFDYYPESEGGRVNCSYSKVVESEGEFDRVETYSMTKNNVGDNMYNEQLAEFIKKMTGKSDFEILVKSDLTDEEITAVKDALETIIGYKEDLPEDLAKAVTLLAEYAAKDIKKESDSDEDADNKDNPDADKEPENKDDGDAQDDDGNELAKSMEALTKSIQDMQSQLKDGMETVDGINTRLETVEKNTGVRKSITGQDDTVVKSDCKFPSLKSL